MARKKKPEVEAAPPAPPPAPPMKTEEIPLPGTLEEHLERVALLLATRLRRGDPPLPDEVAAFKALSAYWALARKLTPPEDEASKGAFHGIARTLSGDSDRGSAGDGGGTVTPLRPVRSAPDW